MKILVVLAHPNKDSFNHAIAQSAISALKKNSHEIIFHDLYQEKFDPIMPLEEITAQKYATKDKIIIKHREELKNAEGIIIIHPNWWAQPPAILRGWVDRVFVPDVAYKFGVNDKGEGVPIGLLKAKTALVFNTSNTPQEREVAYFGDPLENLWKTCIFDFCGIKTFFRKMFNVIIISKPEERRKWLEEVEKTVNNFFPLA
ncbi:MAG: NAD(P)H-dependent oxidoreductase [Candidatus Omnitrophica bacterium]|nr:NAD(P)H-dependent oxidoreductase [Candidatus Omnitrophota bacterium]